MSDSTPLLELAVRHGLLSAADAARLTTVKTPDDLVTLGLITEADGRTLHALLRQSRPSSPRKIGRYEILGELGRGGMGVVYRAQDDSLGRPVALKAVREGAVEQERLRFLREARAAAALRHPNIVPVYDVGEEDGRPYFVMELVEGINLQQARERMTLSRREMVEIVRQAAEGVAFAHEQGVIHRDLKPANILVTPRKQARVMDFGLARTREGEAEGLTVSGVALGTPAYMSPEQARGRWKEVDARSDVYGLGATLYHMLCGAPPFEAGSMPDLLSKVVSEEPIRPRFVEPSIDRDLETVCLKALEKERDRRYPTAKAMADDLARTLAGEPILAHPPSVWSRIGKKMRRNKPWVIAGIVAGLAALAAAAPFVWPGRAEIDSSPPGAEIWLNGKNTGRRTPARLTLWPPGRHSIVLKRDRYADAPFDLNVRARETLRFAPPLAALCGSVRLDGTGARVRLEPIDRSDVGIVEIALPAGETLLPIGRYRLTAHAENHFPERSEILVTEKQPVSKTIRLRPMVLWTSPRRIEILERIGTSSVFLASNPAQAQSVYAVSGADGKDLWRLWTPGRLPVLYVRNAGDVNGDGTPDGLIPTFHELECTNGRTGRPLAKWETRLDEPTARQNPHDLDGDGCAEFVTTGKDSLQLCSPRTPEPLWEIPWTTAPAMVDLAAGDLDLDGRGDLTLVSAPRDRIVALSGKDGVILWDKRISMRDRLHAVGDADRDRVPDFLLLSAESDRGMRCLSGRTGELVWRRPIVVLSAADPADLDGDGIGDSLVAGERGLELVSGRSGERIWECPQAGIVRSLAVTGDRNALAVLGDSELIAVSGRDGGVLWTFASVEPLASPLEVGDQDGDGGPDVALGSGDWVRFLRGRSGTELWRVRTGPARPAASADLDGDGIQETLVLTSDALHALSGRAP